MAAEQAGWLQQRLHLHSPVQLAEEGSRAPGSKREEQAAHQNWQATKVASEKPMIIRHAMKPTELETAAMPKVADAHSSCSTPWP